MEKITTYEYVGRVMARQGRPCLDHRGWPAAVYRDLRSPSGACLGVRMSQVMCTDIEQSVESAVADGHDRELLADLEWAHERWAAGGDWADLYAAVGEMHDIRA